MSFGGLPRSTGWHIWVTGPLTQTPPMQTSPDVQELPSSHGLVLLLWTQPVAGWHASLVQGLPSLQLRAMPPRQTPAEHTSPSVHALPSLQAAVLLAWTQPLAGTQESVVHGLPSSQLRAVPGRQVPAEHLSPVVHALPSSQVAVFDACTHTDPLNESVVQGLLSLQSTVQPGIGECVQPLAALQESAVQGLPSSQLTGVWRQTSNSDSPGPGTWHQSTVHGLESPQLGTPGPTGPGPTAWHAHSVADSGWHSVSAPARTLSESVTNKTPKVAATSRMEFLPMVADCSNHASVTRSEFQPLERDSAPCSREDAGDWRRTG
jgi:hypothetical protein